MKSTIIKTIISDKKLKEDIEEFEIITNQHAYLIMNSDTCYALAKSYKDVLPDYLWNKEMAKAKHPDGIIGSFTGNKIFCDDDLDFGIVEIR